MAFIDKENIFNRDGFIWWIGVVEDRKEDPDRLGRVRVRIMGYHSDDLEILPTEELPWAIVMQPTTSAAVSGVGSSPTNLVEGTWVLGFFLDGKDKQQPVVMGTIGGYTQKVPFCGQEPLYTQTVITPTEVPVTNTVFDENGDPIFNPASNVQLTYEIVRGTGEEWAQENELETLPTEAYQDPNKEFPRCEYVDKPDTNFLATGDVEETDTVVSRRLEDLDEDVPVALSGESWDEPPPAYCTEYPYNQVFETEAGHVVEFDNTPGHERIQLYHKSGTYIEIDANSTMVRKVKGDNYEIFEHNNYVHVKGKYNVTVDGATRILVQGDAALEVKGDLFQKVEGSYNLEVGGDFRYKIGGSIHATTSGSVNYSPGGAFNVNAGGIVALDGDAVHLNSGLAATALSTSMGLDDTIEPTQERLDCFLEPIEYPEDPEEEDFLEEGGEGIVGYDPDEFERLDVEGTDFGFIDSNPFDDLLPDGLVEVEVRDIESTAMFTDGFRVSENFDLGDLV